MPPCFLRKNEMKFWSNLSYHNKIFSGMLIAAILPLLVYFFFVTQIFGVYNRKAQEKEAKETLALIDQNLREDFSYLSDGMDEMERDPSIRALLTREAEGMNPALYRQSHMLERQYSAYADLAVYDTQGKRVFFTGDGSHLKETMALDWGLLFEAGREPDALIVRNANLYVGKGKESYVNLGKAIRDKSGKIIGYAAAAVYGTGFDTMLHELYPAETGVIHILDDFRKPVYSSLATGDDAAFLSVQNEMLTDNSDMKNSEDGSYRYYHLFDEKIRLHLFYRQSVIAQNRLLRTLLIFALLAAGTSLLICFILSQRFSHTFYAPIGRITDAINRIKGGEYDVRIDEEKIGKDELGSLSRNVNKMAEQLLENTERLIERERDLGNANIKMMQAQLNPHFLYNALDTMKWIGKEYDVPEVTTISSGLSVILRSSISSEQLIPLKEELALIDDYTRIQQIRFDDKFELLTDIPKELLGVMIPKLILQPTVENAIVHGFENMDNGQILITAEQVGEEILIKVRDNGCGISKEECARLNETGFTPRTVERYGRGSIGLHHVHAIIRLHYGEAYGLTIESEEGKGTTVLYRLPI